MNAPLLWNIARSTIRSVRRGVLARAIAADWIAAVVATCVIASAPQTTAGELESPPAGFVSLIQADTLSGWQAEIGTPPDVARLSLQAREILQTTADAEIVKHWSIADGVITSDGKGKNLRTTNEYSDFELYVDWRISALSDSGIYLRGFPQVQIWDPGNPREQINGADKGSGGLWNNVKHPRLPLVLADRPIGQWNQFYIRMIGQQVTVWLNDRLTVDDVPLEDAWTHARELPVRGALVLQSHGSQADFRRIFIRELNLPRRHLSAHAHNDYEHPHPLFDALMLGFSSIEADIFLIGDKLLVAHDLAHIRPERSLAALYLKPLLRLLGRPGAPAATKADSLTLLVDIKSEGESTYKQLKKELEPYHNLLTHWDAGVETLGAVTVVLTGNVPVKTVAAESVRYVGIDGRLDDVEDDALKNSVPIVSANWNDQFTWTGGGQMPPAERKKLSALADTVHQRRARLRFWATPETVECWRTLLDCGVDLIGADNLSALHSFLEQAD